MAATCEFQTLHDGLVRDRIVCGIKNQGLKERLLRETDLNLTKAVYICRAAEVSREQVKSLSDKTPANVDAVRKDDQRDQRTKQHDPQGERPTRRPHNKTCGNCGKSHERKQCPAYGNTCNSCGKNGHFAKLCRSRKNRPIYNQNSHVRHLELDSDTPEHGIDEVRGSTNPSTNEHATLKINNKPVQLILDSGAETNILTKSDFEKVVPQ